MAKHDDLVYKLFEEDGLSYKQIADKLGITEKAVNHALYRGRQKRDLVNKQEVDISEKLIKTLRNGRQSAADLADRHNCAPRHIKQEIQQLVDKGHDIFEEQGEYFLATTPQEEEGLYRLNLPDGLFKFGVVSDTHLNSRYQQLTYLKEFYRMCAENGIEYVFHVGDITDGEGMYKGHEYEVFNIGGDRQASYVADNYPREQGIKTIMISGNHCLCYYKKVGVDMGRMVADRRSDFVYLGQLGANVELTPGVIMYLLHPDGGGAYAHSYKPQRIAAGFVGGEKPNIMLIGHYHQTEYLFERNIHILQCGSFQSQTPYLKRKGMQPKIGGWICEAEIRDGSVVSFGSKLRPWFMGNKHDY